MCVCVYIYIYIYIYIFYTISFCLLGYYLSIYYFQLDMESHFSFLLLEKCREGER